MSPSLSYDSLTCSAFFLKNKSDILQEFLSSSDAEVPEMTGICGFALLLFLSLRQGCPNLLHRGFDEVKMCGNQLISLHALNPYNNTEW